MRKLLIAGCVGSLAAGTLALAQSSSPRGGLIVHEWGTFLAMNGSDGVTLDGMYHEEHALPGFVHARSRDELSMRTSNLKGETPVIYFYTDTAKRVSVEVGFPKGVWTQWYPQADYVGPSYVQTASLLRPGHGRIAWTVDVDPSPSTATLPVTSRDALWNFTRDVDAAFVTTTSANQPKERERFIFYRGLGEAGLPLSVSTTKSGQLQCGADLSGGLRHIYLLRVEKGQGAYRYLPSLQCGDQIDRVLPELDGALPVERFADAVAEDLSKRLVDSGLYEKEARAMTNTWRTSYFTTDGIRVLFVLPQSWTDRFIPMTIRPQPEKIVRVMVGRIELLTPDREHAVERAITGLASPDSRVRETSFTTLREQGRYAEPLVRRTLESSTDERVRTLCRRLLLTDFVTDIRTSLTSADEGRPLLQEPVYARAQLASLLRDMGLADEARQEGERALTELARLPRPTLTDHASRNQFRAFARASEGAGHDSDALKWYGEFVEFGGGFNRCSGCHTLAGPRDVSFFRDWWVGEKYAALAWKTGAAPRLIEASEEALAKTPDNLAARLRLAYLHAGGGDTTRAARIWSEIDRRGDARVTEAR